MSWPAILGCLAISTAASLARRRRQCPTCWGHGGIWTRVGGRWLRVTCPNRTRHQERP